MKLTPETAGTNLPNTSFKDFVQACVNKQVFGNIAFEQWQRARFRETLSSEYSAFVLTNLTQANGDISKLHGGNFYDWMADVKGIQLTEDEMALRTRKDPSLPDSPHES